MARINNIVQHRYTAPTTTHLDDETYKKVLPVWVKACLDIILYYQHQDGTWRIVIGKRRNPPLQNQWWIAGGRLLATDLTLQDGAIRKVSEELGIKLSRQQVPEHSEIINYFHWEEDKSIVLAPAMFVQLTTEQATAAPPVNSPEFSQVQHIDPRLIANASSPYNQNLRQIVTQFIESGCIG